MSREEALARLAQELGLSLEYESAQFARVRPVLEEWLTAHFDAEADRAAFLEWLESRWRTGGIPVPSDGLPGNGQEKYRKHRYGDWTLPRPTGHAE